MKRFSLIILATLLSVAAMAQGLTGGITATVVNRAGRTPVAGAAIELQQSGETVATVVSDESGKFLIEGLENGNYSLQVSAEGFISTQVNVAVEKGFVRNLMFVTLTQQTQINDVDASSFAEFDLDDSGYSDSPTILFGSNDVYNNVVGYGFSSVRFKNRGYNSETQDVLLAGVRMNDAITGYSPYSLWSGLNEAMRSKETTMGLESSDAAAGAYNGVTNIFAVPSSVRTGWRFSVLSNSALYRMRLMASYSSGVLDNGWSYAFNASARLGGNDWVEGVYYRSFAFYAGAEKRFNDQNRLALFAFATPGQRGAQNASTQEVYDMMGDNMYNSNWGYQNGKVRNSRVRKTFEPVVGLKYDYIPSTEFRASATALYRFGYNGYTALDWYDAMDPRPDYYRNLPSYFYMDGDDDNEYNRLNEDKAEWAEFAWTQRYKSFMKYQHLDWDRLYNVNLNNADGRSKYALEERHVDQHDFNLATSAKWTPDENMTITGGINAKVNCTENYKKINDLLGGQYYMNIDQFAERDFAVNQALLQNDLDYYLNHGEAQKIGKGDKYGYDYLAQIRKINAWLNFKTTVGGFTYSQTATLGYESFWRDGLVRKGLFAGTPEQVANLNATYGTNLVSNGETSLGKSKVSSFIPYSTKAHLAYVLKGGHRFSANLGYFEEAPTFNQAFISPRTRNTLVDGLENKVIKSADLNYQFTNSGYNLRVTGFYTTIENQTDVMSFYDDSQQSFTNFAMTGIDQRHIGIEAGLKVPLPVQGLSATAVASWGEYVYTSTPHMVQTVDNSAEIVRNEEVPYWKSHPIFDAAGNVVGAQKHYVPSTPQLATEFALNYRLKSYWFFELNGQYIAHSYLDMNPLYRTHFACAGPDGIETPSEVTYMASQEEFAPAFLLNASIGKSWYIQRKYNLGFSLELNNMTNNTGVKTGGYEQTRLITSSSKSQYFRFDSKYFYMYGFNYMLNLYFRF